MNKNIKMILILVLAVLACGSFLRQGEMTEEEARNLVTYFSPILRFHKNEKYFPASIEWFDIDWAKATLNDPEAEVSYTYLGPNSVNLKANIYASVLTNTDGTVRISYAFLYTFNDCGPYLSANVDTYIGNFSEKFLLCPLGRHFGDIEHITLTLDYDLKTILSLIYAYHDSYRELQPNEVEYLNGIPVVYVALGSHASYPKSGEQDYMAIWNYIGYTFSTRGTLSEKISTKNSKDLESGHRFPVRLLKFNGNPTSDITKEESYLAFLYQGRVGTKIVNTKFDQFVSDATAFAPPLIILNSKAFDKLMGGILKLKSLANKKACHSLAGPGRESWW